MATAPRVSVVVSTHDRASLLVEAVESVLRQSLHDLEILVCDDGSTDETAARVTALRGPIRYLRLEHTGSPARARNRGIECARGELLAFLDDDDLWHPEKLARQAAALDAEPAAGVAYTDARLLFSDGSLSGTLLSAEERRSGPLFSRLLRNCFLHPSTVLVRRDALARAGGFDESLFISEDYDLFLRLARVTRGVCVPEPLVHVRRHPASHSERSGVRSYEDAIRVLERQRGSGTLTLAERLGCRAAVARLHGRAARVALESGDPAAARRHSRRSLRLNPVQRPAWSMLWRSRAAPPAG
jgi:glycosyltransferase involved in cell wall biosynthesis